MGRLNFLLLTITLLLPLLLLSATAYNVGEHVPLFVNKVGPLHNPSETYQYYEMPFCRPDRILEKKETLGEVLNGDRLANALYELEFAVNKTGVVLCNRKLDRGNVAKFRAAIMNDFYYQMYYDDLPFWAFIGKIEDESWGVDGKGTKYFLFKHVQFDALYNGNQVIEIRAFGDPSHVLDVTEDVDLEVEFIYSVLWNDISTPYKNRMDRYSQTSMIPLLRKTHWFSCVNSIVVIILVMGLLTVLFMRHLKNDLRKWSVGDEEEDKEVGWKYIHGDVFRCPTNMPVFCAVLGSGTQLLTLVFALFILAFLGILYPYNRGALSTAIFAVYTLTSAVAGYSSASFYSQFVETGWQRSILLAGVLFPGPFLFTVFILNSLAIYFGVTAALPFGTIFVIFLIYTLVAIPLFALGGMVGHHYKSKFLPPSVTKKYRREIPSLAWYRKIPAQMFLGGLLPFSATVLEFHHLCATIWGYKISTLPAILFITFASLVILTAMLSVGLTFFQLAVEDHEWWWRSVLCGGSTAIFMFAYCIYFYFKSNMSGVLQTFIFFGYSACMCYAFFLMLGALSFRASLMFVRHIYRGVKSE
ncbi:Transmembrane 9 superfamily member 5 [Abeliophyllum distichum]|uniref:Transmembrane 9 superfamily member n=1 Tax=Abeliophyllum distichum TaxID=126358 RepID=A0ABD1TED7_9LAMI